MIVAAAIRHDGTVYALPAPNRHHDIIHYMGQNGIGERLPSGIVHAKGEQGFVDSNRGFVNRRKAALIALEEGQITKLSFPPELFSEDLW